MASAPSACAGGFLWFFLFAARDRLQAFHIRDGLFKNMAEDRDRDFGREVILAQGLETFADGVDSGWVQNSTLSAPFTCFSIYIRL